MQEDTEEYDKMPNLVSQESPSRTLGFVTVPLRQTGASGGGSSKFQLQLCYYIIRSNCTKNI